VILKYTPDEARILKNNGQLPESTKLNEAGDEDMGGVEFSEHKRFFHFIFMHRCFLVDSGEHYSEDEVAAQDRNFSLSESSEDEETDEEEEEDEDEKHQQKAATKAK
jgi:hypothetical protein